MEGFGLLSAKAWLRGPFVRNVVFQETFSLCSSLLSHIKSHV